MKKEIVSIESAIEGELMPRHHTISLTSFTNTTLGVDQEDLARRLEGQIRFLNARELNE